MTTDTTTRTSGTELRTMMGCWTTGVTVVTTRSDNGTPIGLVCNSFTSVSLDPPLISWCIDSGSLAIDTWNTCPTFSVHVLAEADLDLVPRFAARGVDKFAGLDTHETALGTPGITGVATRLDCRVWARYEGGDHVILVGEVLSHAHEGPFPPLTNHALRRG